MSVSRLRSSKELRPLVDRCYRHWQPQFPGRPPAGRAIPESVPAQAPAAELGFLRAGSRDIHSLSDGARAASTVAKAWSGLGGYLSTAQAAAATAATTAFRPSVLGVSSRDSHLSPLLVSALRLFRVRSCATCRSCGMLSKLCAWPSSSEHRGRTLLCTKRQDVRKCEPGD